MRRIFASLPRWFRVSAAVCLGGAVLVVAAFVFVQTPPGKRMLAREGSRILTNATDLTWTIEGIEGFVPLNTSIDTLAIEGPSGPLVSVRRLRVHVPLRALIRGAMHLSELSVERVHLEGLPETDSTLSEKLESLTRVPDMLLGIRLDAVRIQHFKIDEALFGVPFDFAIDGTWRRPSSVGALSSHVIVEGRNETATRLELRIESDAEHPLAAFHIQGEDTSFLPGRLPWPEAQSVSITVKGEDGAEGGEAAVLLNGTALLEGRLRIVRGAVPALHGEGLIHLEHSVLPASYAETTGGEGRWSVALGWPSPGRVSLDNFAYSSDAGSVHISGSYGLDARELDAQVRGTYLDMRRIVHVPDELPAGPWNAAVQAAGTLDALEGALQVDAGTDLSVEADWALLLTPLPALTCNLRAALSPSILPDQLVWLDEIRASLSVEQDHDGVFRIPGSVVHTPGGTVELTAALDPAEHFAEARVALRFEDLGVLESVMPEGVAGGLSAVLALHAKGSDLRVEIEARSDQIAIAEDVALNRPEISLELQGPSWWHEGAKRYDVRSRGRGGVAAPALYDAEVRFALDGDVLSFADVAVRSLEVTDGNILLAVTGGGNIQDKTAHALVDLHVAEVGALPVLGEREYGGSVMVQAEASASPERTLAELEFELADISGLPEAVLAFLGTRMHGAASIDVDGSTVRWRLARAEAGPFSVEGDGTYAFEDGVLEIQAAFDCSSVSGLRDLAGVDLAGAFSGSMDLSLHEGDADLRLDAATSTLSIAHWRLDSLRIVAAAEGPVEAPTGTLSVALTANEVLLDAETAWRYAADVIAVERGMIRAGENTLELQAHYDLGARVFDSGIEAVMPDLAVIGRLAELPLEGSGRISAAATLGPGASALQVDAALGSVGTPWGSIAEATVFADLHGEFAAPEGQCRISLSGARLGGAELAVARLYAEGDREAMAIEGLVEGSWEAQAFEAVVSGTFREAATEFTLDRLDGRFDDIAFELKNSAVLRRDDHDWTVRGFVLTLADGEVGFAGGYTPEAIIADLSWERLPLSLVRAAGVPSLVEGSAAGAVSLRGTPANPVVEAAIQLEGVRVPQESQPDVLAADARCLVTIEDGRVTAELNADADDAFTLRGRGSMPLRFALVPFAANLTQEGAIEGALRAEGRLEAIGLIVPIERHQITGPIEAHLDVSGSVSRPQVQGLVQITEARYENQVTGTILEDIQLSVSADGPALTLTSFEAATKPQGRLSASGQCALNPSAGFPFEIEVHLERARAVNRDDLWVEIDGSVRAVGSTEGGRVDGDITLNRGALRVPRRLPVHVVTIPVHERNVPKDAEQPAAPVLPLVSIALDVTCRVPGRFYVRTDGLESEWAGQLTVAGTAAKPEIRGDLRVRRGELMFLDRRFDLRDSTIALDGRFPPEPHFDLLATARTREITAGIRLFGEMDAIELSLESEPPVPEDQILSRLLFDRDLNDLSPVQALQLARTAAALSNTAFGLAALPTGPALPFVDRVSLDAGGEGSETGVGLGKYLGERAYIEVHQGLGAESGKVSVELEITPNLSVQSEVEADSQGALGLFWKKDY